MEVAAEANHIQHNFLALSLDEDPQDELVTASKEGLYALKRNKNGTWSRTLIGEGAPGEVKLGRVGGRRMLGDRRTVARCPGSSSTPRSPACGPGRRSRRRSPRTTPWPGPTSTATATTSWPRAGAAPRAHGLAIYAVDREGTLESKTMVDDERHGHGRPDRRGLRRRQAARHRGLGTLHAKHQDLLEPDPREQIGWPRFPWRPKPTRSSTPTAASSCVDTARIEQSPLYNHDLAPVPVARRNWTTYNYAALWISMAHCIPTYMLASGLMATGMNWWQALITILLGNTIVLIPILLNSHPGTKYGIPFPVFARAAYGTIGSNLPALMRALVACGWFGIQAWIGGEALHTLLHSRSSPAGPRCSARASAGTPPPSGSRSCSSGASTSSSSTAAWTCCGRWRTGRRRSCW